MATGCLISPTFFLLKPPPLDPTATLCLPGPEIWELWKPTPSGWQRVPGSESTTSPSAFKSAALFAFPVSSTFAVPIRAATDDPDLLPDIIEIQLEKQGLKPDAPVGCLTDWRIVDREENQTLVCAAVLNPGLPEELPKEAPARFELSPYLYDLPDDSLVIWKELGRLVFAVTRRDHPVYFHALSASHLTLGVVQEIEQLLMPVYTQGFVTALDAVVIWGNPGSTAAPDPAVDAAFQVTFGGRVLHLPKPPPRPGTRVSALEPVSVAQGKIRAARAARIQKIATACVLAYLLVPGFFAFRYFMEQRKVDVLKSRVAGLESNYGNIQGTIDQANLADAAINFKQYPVELLFQCLTSLYDTATPGVRISGFEVEKDQGEKKLSQITIKGEANNANTQAAIVYATKVKGNPELQNFKWEYKAQAPKDGKVPFDIVGITKDDTSETT